MDYIPIDKCVDGNVYKIAARNGSFGIYSVTEKSFTLSRFKFGDNFLFDEYHWDTGEPFGTVKPMEDLGPAPTFKEEADKLKYLNDLTESEKDNG